MHLELVELISRGGYSQVWETACGEVVKVNVVSEKCGGYASLKELDILRQLNSQGHPNVIKLVRSEFSRPVVEVGDGAVDGVHFVFEKFDRTLASIIFDRPREVVRFCLGRQAIAGVLAVHAHGLVHCDISPYNFLYRGSDGLLVLTDFGKSMWTAGEDVDALIGTPGYRAPEVLTGSWSQKSDVWSLGKILEELGVADKFPHGEECTLDDPDMRPDVSAVGVVDVAEVFAPLPPLDVGKRLTSDDSVAMLDILTEWTRTVSSVSVSVIFRVLCLMYRCRHRLPDVSVEDLTIASLWMAVKVSGVDPTPVDEFNWPSGFDEHHDVCRVERRILGVVDAVYISGPYEHLTADGPVLDGVAFEAFEKELALRSES